MPEGCGHLDVHICTFVITIGAILFMYMYTMYVVLIFFVVQLTAILHYGVLCHVEFDTTLLHVVDAYLAARLRCYSFNMIFLHLLYSDNRLRINRLRH